VAVAACHATATPLIRFERAAWHPTHGDRWTDVPDMPAAAQALGKPPRRVFLSIGRLEIRAFSAAPQHDYLIRAVDMFATELPRARIVAARGPFELADERKLLEDARIEILVSKNSGTEATHAKIVAARELGISVIMVARPQLPAAPSADTLERILAWLDELHGNTPSLRGE
jgi:precorrin-6A/cobalt-precorrin-6A reductase